MTRVVVVSESAFSVQGHGVHTAYIETVNGLGNLNDINLRTNSFSAADVRHIHTVGPYSLIHLLLGSGRKVVSAHVVPESFVGSLVGAKFWLPLARVYLRWFYNRANSVIAVSDKTKSDLLDLGVNKPIEVVYNMIDTSYYRDRSLDRVALRTKYNIPAKSFVVVGNGQVQPRKRVDTFVRLAKELPNMYFIWVGGMPFKHAAADYQKMKRMIDDPPANLRFTGVVERSEVRGYFQASDVFMLPSDQETFGLAVVEAAASGLPVVLRNISDYDQTFRPFALMCSESEFAGTLKTLRADTKLYEKMQRSAERLAAAYDSQTIAKQLVAIYQAI